MRTCQLNGTWDGSPPICSRKCALRLHPFPDFCNQIRMQYLYKAFLIEQRQILISISYIICYSAIRQGI